jgi:hypothetical protein
VRDLSEALSGFTVAVSWAVPLIAISSEDLSRVTPVTATMAGLTVTVAFPDIAPAVADMVAEPSLRAVTLPELSTEAISAWSDAQVRDLSEALSGATVATSVTDSPAVSSSEDLSRVTPVTATMAGLTVTEALPDIAPAVADMVAEPALRAVTLPELSTEATDLSDEAQERDLSEALSGRTVAESEADSPSVREREAGETETLFTATSAFSFPQEAARRAAASRRRPAR